MAAVAMLVAGCTSGAAHTRFAERDSAGITLAENEARATPPVLWRAEEQFSIGAAEGAGEALFGYVAHVTVDAAGRIYALDQQANEVRVFDGSGRFLRKLGRPGKGPGELSRFANAVLVTSDQSIWVPDYSQARINVYDTTGAVLGTHPISTQPGGRSWLLTRDGQLLYRGLTTFRDEQRNFRSWDALLRTRVGAAAVDTLLVFEYAQTPLGGGAERLRIPLILNSVFWAQLPDGRIAWSTLDHESVSVHNADGALERIVRFSTWKRAPATPDDQRALVELLREKLQFLGGSPSVADGPTVDPPAHLPAITDVRAGPDSTLWVQRVGDIADFDFMSVNTRDTPQGFGGRNWDVFDPVGRLLGTVELPARFRLYEIHDERAYGVTTDSLGVQRVVVLGLQRAGR